MEEKERKKFQILIEKHITQIKSDVENLKALVKPVSPDNSIGRLSRMEALNEKSINEKNLSEVSNRLLRLENAAKSVLTKDYGLCTKCEEDISKKRLEILPESSICMTCLNHKE